MPKIAKDKEVLNDKNISKKIDKKTVKNTILDVSTQSKNKNITKNKKNLLKKTITKKIYKKNKFYKSNTYNNVSKKNINLANKKNIKFLPEFYDLPYKYNKTVVKILAQTPQSLFVYWEVSDDDKNFLKQKYGDNFFETTTPILKVHNKTKNYTFEVQINDFANCWYLHVNDSKCVYEIELDRRANTLASENQYIYICSSNDIELPNDHILFEQNLSKVQFKNVKTNEIVNVDITKNSSKIYNTKYLYNLLYTKEELDNFADFSNPSSGNSTSTFK